MIELSPNAGGFRRATATIVSALLMLLTAAVPIAAQKAAVDNCVSCHEGLDGGPASVTALETGSVHRHAGFTCAGCHGGDPGADDAELSMSAAKGFVGAPAPAAVAEFCGRCHSDAAIMKRFNPATRIDQQTEYASSGHGKTLAKGDTKVATCVSCHGSHGILKVDDANAPVHPLNVAKTCGSCHGNKDLMTAYGVFTDQVAHYRTSVHAIALHEKQDLSAPTCNDCHGNHGAAPPGVASVAHVCGTCHVRQSDLYAASPHMKPFTEGGIAGCVACHGEHGIARPVDEHLGSGPTSMCRSCHSEGDKGWRVGEQLRSGLAMMELSIAAADRSLARASEAGMEVSRPEFELRDARDKLVNARVMIHSLSVADIDSLVASSQATSTKAKEAGIAAMHELDYRRNGLGLSLVVIMVAAVSVYVKVRTIERSRAGRTGAGASRPVTNGAHGAGGTKMPMGDA